MLNNKVCYDVLTPVNFIKRSAVVYKNKIGVIYNDQRYTYEEFYNRVKRLANALKNMGIGKGDKVAFICPNTPPMLEAHFAVPMIGAALVSINIRLMEKEVSYIINHSDAKALFVDNEFAKLVNPGALNNVATYINICDISDEKPLDGMDYEAFLATGSEDPVETEVDDEYQVATINYTSGTTGLPKGVMYHHRGAYLNALGEALEIGMNSRSVYLWTLPMFHCNGWCFTWGVTAVGGTNICLRKVVPEEIYRLVEVEGVSHLCAAPTVLISMSTYPKAKDVKMKRELNIMTAGAPPAPTIIKNMEAIGAIVTQTYGLTEVFGPHSICEWQEEWDSLPEDERAKIKARQGVAYITAMYMDVVDPATMESVPWDGETIGEIVMRGNNVMLGYYKQPEATAEAFRGGWFHSGDLAAMHPNGYAEIKDRMKDIIISGGENISTVEVENVIYAHPDVQEVAVVGIPDPKWGEVPKAYIVPRPGSDLTVEDIISYCRENMARFKVPKAIEFGELPKTSTGKIMKYKLREKEWAGRDRKVN
ncbi:fatty-acyl-CoA synthase [Desulfotomaculum arcticum]|uniref:Fatty-acyl-CoA synthase n=1 Tax=Desulfotruncus arcticus DSM 17038 TaxID=1121424 RepID=A0A1I2N2P7_9FIRM|nr:acyl--CoA ligase family protein [Desulfotruncus arcticus]SFF97370.1 fatty-acyl-CoA synthase [Desulfotomaculum arcticum] [Desulfotruncus arcticus DSM 17038]